MESTLFLHRATMGRPGLAQKLEQHYGDAESVLRAFDPRETPLPDAVTKRLQSLPKMQHEVARDLAWLEKGSRHLLDQAHPAYPSQLKSLSDAPYLLFVWGETYHLGKDQIAVVGSRSPTPQGLSSAAEMSRQLSRAGFTITSGMAIGIDGAAHRAALEVGGATVAVQGCGIDLVYPRSHERLARYILEQGCLVSEYPTGVPAHPRHFPQRNRIVTGLCRGTLVVEATIKSGSLISARLAMEQGREVFAVPGSIYAQQSAGCHQLIRQGAALVTSVLDILEEFPEFEIDRRRLPAELSKDEKKILQTLTVGPCHADRIHEQTAIPLDALMAILIDLEIKGIVDSGADGYRVRQP